MMVIIFQGDFCAGRGYNNHWRCLLQASDSFLGMSHDHHLVTSLRKSRYSEQVVFHLYALSPIASQPHLQDKESPRMEDHQIAYPYCQCSYMALHYMAVLTVYHPQMEEWCFDQAADDWCLVLFSDCYSQDHKHLR